MASLADGKPCGGTAVKKGAKVCGQRKEAIFRSGIRMFPAMQE